MTFDVQSNRINTSGWEYDAAGNQTRTQTAGGVWQRHEYDAANRLVSVKADDNVTVLATYTYADTNQRLSSEESGARTYYAAEGGQVFAEYVEYGGGTVPQWAKSYVYLGGRLLTTFAPVTGGEFIEHHHPDRLGTRLVTRPADGTSFEQASLPFGTALAVESTGGTNRRFTSYDRSGATGLDYAVNRRYDPMQGRFTQVDPIEMDAVDLGDPQTLNLYSYCDNDPVNHTDPDGLFFKKLFNFFKKAAKWIAVAVAVAVAVVAVIAFTGGAAAGVVIKLALQSAQLFAQAFGKETLARIFGGAAAGFGNNSGFGGVGAGGTPVFNPNAGTGIGGLSNGFQDGPRVHRDGELATCTTGSDCSSVILLPNESVSITARLAWHERGFFKELGDVAVGVADQFTFGFTKWIDSKRGIGRDEDSGYYQAGGWIGVGFQVAIPAAGATRVAGSARVLLAQRGGVGTGPSNLLRLVAKSNPSESSFGIIFRGRRILDIGRAQIRAGGSRLFHIRFGNGPHRGITLRRLK